MDGKKNVDGRLDGWMDRQMDLTNKWSWMNKYLPEIKNKWMTQMWIWEKTMTSEIMLKYC